MADTKKIIRRLLEEPWTGNFDAIDEHVAPSYVGHDASEPEPIRGPEGYKAQVSKYLTGFPDGRVTADDIVAEGDKVAARWTGRGTQTGEIAGIAPTGKQVTVTGFTLFRLEGEHVVEDWSTWDTLGMLVQLGAVPAPTQA